MVSTNNGGGLSAADVAEAGYSGLHNSVFQKGKEKWKN